MGSFFDADLHNESDLENPCGFCLWNGEGAVVPPLFSQVPDNSGSEMFPQSDQESMDTSCYLNLIPSSPVIQPQLQTSLLNIPSNDYQSNYIQSTQSDNINLLNEFLHSTEQNVNSVNYNQQPKPQTIESNAQTVPICNNPAPELTKQNTPLCSGNCETIEILQYQSIESQAPIVKADSYFTEGWWEMYIKFLRFKASHGTVDLYNDNTRIGTVANFSNLEKTDRILVGGLKGKDEKRKGTTLEKGLRVKTNLIPKDNINGKRKITDLECKLRITLSSCDYKNVKIYETTSFKLASNEKMRNAKKAKLE